MFRSTSARGLQFALATVATTFIAGCDVDVKDPGKAPSVDVDVQGEPGRAPDVDVTGPDVDIQQKEKTIEMPDVEVRTKDKTITVPDVNVTVPDENANETSNE